MLTVFTLISLASARFSCLDAYGHDGLLVSPSWSECRRDAKRLDKAFGGADYQTYRSRFHCDKYAGRIFLRSTTGKCTLSKAERDSLEDLKWFYPNIFECHGHLGDNAIGAGRFFGLGWCESLIDSFNSLGTNAHMKYARKNGMSYIGCYTDSHKRDMIRLGDARSPQECMAKCMKHPERYMLSAMQYSYQCFCDNFIGLNGHYKVDDKECTRKCPDKKHSVCGGSWRNAVFEAQINNGGYRPDFYDLWGIRGFRRRQINELSDHDTNKHAAFGFGQPCETSEDCPVLLHCYQKKCLVDDPASR